MDGRIDFRPIEPSDNKALARIIRAIFDEYEVPESGTAYADPSIEDMYGTFSGARSVYLVALSDKELVGGAGIAPLKGSDQKICELQKMYLQPDARHRGSGRKLLELCLDWARKMGYEKCYLETMSNMRRAQALYKEYGFRYLDERMGKTGHYACPVWMLKEL